MVSTMENRSARVMVKLATGAAPDEVCFTESEREAVVEAAVACGYPYVSTFIREACVDAALATVERNSRTDREVLREAAGACDMKLGAWMRTVVLAAIGHEDAADTPLPVHRREAARWVRRKRARAGG